MDKQTDIRETRNYPEKIYSFTESINLSSPWGQNDQHKLMHFLIVQKWLGFSSMNFYTQKTCLTGTAITN